MSSTRKPQKPAGGPPPERKAAPGPVITPQVLGVVFGLLLIIGVIVFYTQVVKKSNDKILELDNKIQASQKAKETYEKKKAKLEIARKLNTTVREKLQTVTYMFLTDQTSMVPFWEDQFLPILDRSPISQFGGKITVDEYTYKINMAMQPFNTLPPGSFFENAQEFFPIAYEGEKDGVPEDTPLDTRPDAFLTPYTITMEEFRGTYEQVEKFVKELQTKTDKYLYTVHCFANDDSSNEPLYRTTTKWTIVITVYFINPEASASGDDPPVPPGAESC